MKEDNGRYKKIADFLRFVVYPDWHEKSDEEKRGIRKHEVKEKGTASTVLVSFLLVMIVLYGIYSVFYNVLFIGKTTSDKNLIAEKKEKLASSIQGIICIESEKPLSDLTKISENRPKLTATATTEFIKSKYSEDEVLSYYKSVLADKGWKFFKHVKSDSNGKPYSERYFFEKEGYWLGLFFPQPGTESFVKAKLDEGGSLYSIMITDGEKEHWDIYLR